METKIVNTWLIENNKLVNKNKKVSSLKYKDLELYFLKQDEDNGYDMVSLLIKDINGVYWNFDIIHINLKNFENVVLKGENGMNEIYCENIYQKLKKFDLEEYFKGKIKNNRYFNMCELRYILQFHKELHDSALKAREAVIEKNRKISAAYQKEMELKEQEYKKQIYKNFQEDLNKTIDDILGGKYVKSIELEFYKNDKDDEPTIQNCFLYLAEKYNVKIPLATKGFINNKLECYNFEKESYYKNDPKSKGSSKIFEYFRELYEKIKQEYK